MLPVTPNAPTRAYSSTDGPEAGFPRIRLLRVRGVGSGLVQHRRCRYRVA